METDREVHLVDPRELFVRSRRFDLIFKFELANAWAYGTNSEIRIAEEAYLEHIRAHNSFCERIPLRLHPFEFIRDAFGTMRSIFRNGYDVKCPPIPVTASGELLGGAHRLAACAAYNCRCAVKSVPTCVSSCGNSFYSYVKSDMHPSVIEWGIRAYRRRFPDGCLICEFPKGKGLKNPIFPDWKRRADECSCLPLIAGLKKAYYTYTLPIRSRKQRDKAKWKITKIDQKCHSMKTMA